MAISTSISWTPFQSLVPIPHLFPLCPLSPFFILWEWIYQGLKKFLFLLNVSLTLLIIKFERQKGRKQRLHIPSFQKLLFLILFITILSLILFNTVDPWTIQVWTVGPLIRGFFFNSKYYSTTWSKDGWIWGCGTMDREELWVWGNHPCMYRGLIVRCTWIFYCVEG